jgi:hypothetical protein
MTRASSGFGNGWPGGSRTSSIHFPCESSPYVCRLFAFQRARPSVVRAKQPTSTRLRITHGATVTAAAATTASGAQLHPVRRRRYDATTSGTSASRTLPRIARPL